MGLTIMAGLTPFGRLRGAPKRTHCLYYNYYLYLYLSGQRGPLPPVGNFFLSSPILGPNILAYATTLRDKLRSPDVAQPLPRGRRGIILIIIIRVVHLSIIIENGEWRPE